MYRKIILVGMAFFTIVLSGCSAYYKFDNLYDKGDYLNAYQVLSDIKDESSLHYQKRMFRVVTRIALDGDSDFITNKLQKLVTVPFHPEVYNYTLFARTFLLYVLPENTDTQYYIILSNFNRIENVPEEFRDFAFQIKGIAYYQTGQYTNAIKNLVSSYNITPFIDNYYFIGKCYLELQEPDKAMKYFKDVVNITQDKTLKSMAHFQIGEIYYNQHKYSIALPEYIDAVNSKCNSAYYNYKIAKCFQKLGYYRFYSKFLKISFRINEGFATAFFFLNIN